MVIAAIRLSWSINLSLGKNFGHTKLAKIWASFLSIENWGCWSQQKKGQCISHKSHSAEHSNWSSLRRFFMHISSIMLWSVHEVKVGGNFNRFWNKPRTTDFEGIYYIDLIWFCSTSSVPRRCDRNLTDPSNYLLTRHRVSAPLKLSGFTAVDFFSPTVSRSSQKWHPH